MAISPTKAEPKHAVAMHGEPAYAADFKHFKYANPDAPKGGRLTWGLIGSFDSMNPFIVKGQATRGLRDSLLGNNVYESLLARGRDEPFTLYGLLAKTVEMPDERNWVEFHLRSSARFSDGKPVTIDDVIFSHQLLKTKGRPNHRAYYAKITEVKRVGDRGVRFTFGDGKDRELPLILGLMPILPKHLIDPQTFEKSTLKAPIGSGPYVVKEIDAGSRISMARNPDYWGRGLPVKSGHDNFDEIRIDYYRDHNSMFEAFKKGLYDVNPEGDPGRWATAYDFPAVTSGKIVKRQVKTGTPKSLFGFVFNTRKEVFADQRVREALSLLFDFEWVNRNFYHGLYRRTGSYFEGSELSARGRPTDAVEQRLLVPYGKLLHPKILAGTWQPAKSDGSGRDRKLLRAAVKQLADAGWRIKNGVLANSKTGAPFGFEILVRKRDHQRLALALQRTLKLVGIAANVRLVDSTQYQQRLQVYDYDVILNTWYVSLSPGNEQIFRWSKQVADRDGSYNYAGVKSDAVDAMIDAMLAAKTRLEFISAVRALDRVLLSGFYVLPLFHLPEQWVAHRSRIRWPENQSLYGYRPDTWWFEDK